MIDRIESAINYISDLNWAWWPVLFLRPNKTERFSFRLVLLLATPITIIAHGIVILLRLINDQPVPLEAFMFVSVVLFIGVSALFYAIAHFWNRRALRLTQNDG